MTEIPESSSESGGEFEPFSPLWSTSRVWAELCPWRRSLSPLRTEEELPKTRVWREEEASDLKELGCQRRAKVSELKCGYVQRCS